MPDDVIVTTDGRRIRLADVNLRVPYTLQCRLYNCSFDHVGQLLRDYRPHDPQPHLALRFLEPVSRLVAGSSLTLFQQTYPKLGPVVVESGVEAATNLFRSGNPDWNVSGNVELRTRVWRELHFYANGSVQVNGSGKGLEVDHAEFTFGFRIIN